MDCVDLRRGFLAGTPLSGATVDEHLGGCASCADLVQSGATLGRRLAEFSAELQSDVGAGLIATESLIDRERGLRAYLRSRPTRVRWALTLCVPLALLAREFWERPVPWMNLGTPKLIMGLLLLGLMALVVRAALRPAPIGRRKARLCWALTAAACCLPCLLCLAPESRPSPPITGGFAGRALSCFSYGSALSAPAAALLWALDRGMRVPYRVRALATGTMALVANLILIVHCPLTDGVHLWAGHFSIGFVWFVAVTSLQWRLRHVE